MRIFKEFTFEAAHHLPLVPPDHKCRRLHGHSYRVEIHVSGDREQAGSGAGMVMDFGELSAAWAQLHAQLDHYYLNEVEGLFNPTSENLAEWIFTRLKPTLPLLSEVVVRETCTSGASYP